jgi:hypothetical protein
LNTTAERIPTSTGDWGHKNPDNVERAQCGPITENIIDAARLVHLEFRNGVPNFDLYRAVDAGDTLYDRRLLDWTIAFAWVLAEDTMRHKERKAIALVAAHDVLAILRTGRALLPHTTIADRMECHRETYLRLRNRLFVRLDQSLREYRMRLSLHYPRVLRLNRIS